MSLVDVKCPNCGASIQLDNSRDFGFCSYCGSKVQIQEAVRKIEIDKSGDIQSYIALSRASIEAGNGQEAYDYANKALELSTQNAEAWFLKMKALGLMRTTDNLRCREIVTAGSKVLELDSSEDSKINVYRYYLEICIDELKLFCRTEFFYEGDIEQVIALRLAVPDFEVANNNEFISLVEQIAIQWIKFQKTMDDIVDMEEFRNILNRIKQGLPANKQIGINVENMSNGVDTVGNRSKKLDSTEENMPNGGYAFEKPFRQSGGTGNNNSNDNGGCYIATAVYGSYYAPEVLVLRRFRDETLSKYYFGRLFIRVYYLLSPPIARKLGNATTINTMVRSILDKWIRYLSGIQSK